MRFLIASVSKTVTSVAVLKLADEGRLSLDDPIDRGLPADLAGRVPDSHRITIRQLLDHTRGIADYDETSINLQEYQDPDTPVPYQAGLEQGISASPLCPPGANFTYSNVNYILLTLIIEKAAGIPYEDFAARSILIPSGMNDTIFQHTNHIPGPHMRATMPGENGTVKDFTDLYLLFDRGAGDIVSTTSDLNRFHRELREGKLISKASVAAMEQPTPQSGNAGYGLGYITGVIVPANITVQGHTGGYAGSFTFWYYLPDSDTYVTFNLNSAGTTPDNLRVIRAAVLGSLPEGRTVPPLPAPAAQDVTMTVPFAPIPVAGRDGINLAYEIGLGLPNGRTAVPEMIEILDPVTGTVLFMADGIKLAGLFHSATTPPPSDEERRDGITKLSAPRVSLWFTVSGDAVPDRLVHRIPVDPSGSGLSPLTSTGGEVVVRKDLAPVVIGPPLRGAGWMAMETTAPLTHHFLGQITMANRTRVPQRYAQDWVYIDPQSGNVALGNVSLAKNFFGYGREILSVAGGTVIEAVNDQPENEFTYSHSPMDLSNAAGNYVIVDIGDRKYACYGHMVPGSVRVKEGDRVSEGQVLGLVGNSGNSYIPHLHFQVVTDEASFLGAEGYPQVYRSFEVTGTINVTLADERVPVPGSTFNEVWEEFRDFVIPSRTPLLQENRLPENGDIVRFP